MKSEEVIPIIIDEDMKQRLIAAALKDVAKGHEDPDCIDRTETEVQVLLGLIKIIEQQDSQLQYVTEVTSEYEKELKKYGVIPL